jgi:benzoate/toluate 1,2-dioxygenase subunit beta
MDTTSLERQTRLFQEVSAFLAREARLLDDKNWQGWLDLFAPEGRLWAPAWIDDDAMTTDPATQASLIFAERADLEARVFRIEGDDSYATMPLPQTSHIVMCTEALESGDEIHAQANWFVHFFWRTKGAHLRAGRYRHTLRRAGDEFKIVMKKVIIYDDRVVGPIDIYNI